MLQEPKEYIYKTVGDRPIPFLFYPPENPSPAAPLLLLVPGGGWRLSNAESMYGMERSACEALRREGFAVAALSYRNRKDDGVNMRQMVADVFDGLTFLVAHAAEFAIDPHRVYTSGHSAGAHLALLLAYAPADLLAGERAYPPAAYTVRGTVPLSPPTFLPMGDGKPYLQFSVDDLFVGCAPEDYALCSPETYAASGVPSLIAVGERDELVFPENGRRLARLLAENGVEARLIESLRGGHCFEPIRAESSAPTLAEILDEMADFLRKREKIRYNP